MAKKRHAYTEEFRREAVRRADQPGNTAASVAKELELHPGQIYNWRRQFTRLSESSSTRWMVLIIPGRNQKRYAASSVS